MSIANGLNGIKYEREKGKGYWFCYPIANFNNICFLQAVYQSDSFIRHK
jgi:hypothetical protein